MSIKTITFVLPADWAGYLLNKGIPDDGVDQSPIQAFLDKEGVGPCLTCGDSFFARNNDAQTGEEGDCCEFTFEAAPEFTSLQTRVLELYQAGEFSHIKRPDQLPDCGNGLLRFLVNEAEDVEDLSEYDGRLERVFQQIWDLRQGLKKPV